jgi:hypothetical protein
MLKFFIGHHTHQVITCQSIQSIRIAKCDNSNLVWRDLSADKGGESTPLGAAAAAPESS